MNPKKLVEQLELTRIYHAPKREDKDRYVGVEIEFHSPFNTDVVRALLATAGLGGYVTVGFDGTPPYGRTGYEWQVLMKESEVKRILTKVGKLIKAIDGKCNASCGFHVHLDMRNRNPKQAFNNLVLAQPILFGVAHKRRRFSAWCAPVIDRDIATVGTSKYQAINPHCRENKNTIEVRIREGIVDTNDIVNWVRLLVAIADNKYLTKDLKTFGDLEENVRLSRYVRKYVYEKFKNKKDKTLFRKTAA